MPVESEVLRQAMRKWPTGVSIVTASHHGVRHGMTVSSFASVSLEPPAVLISLERNSRTHDLVLDSGTFGVTFLNSHQQAISERFAGRDTEYRDRFADLETITLLSGAPLLVGGLAQLDCRVVNWQEAGTNTLFIGEVLAAQAREAGEPLLYFDRQYRQLQD